MDEQIADFPEAWQAYAEVLRPRQFMKPSEYAATHRHLAESEAERPGKWSNDYFPYLKAIMDSVHDAIMKGARGWTCMKSAQGGGSQAIINVWAWLQDYYPGPIGYMISKDEFAKEFGRTRFTHCLDTIEPLRRKALRGKAGGESITKKRFLDGMLSIFGGQSVLNLQTVPFRWVIIDEVDSLMDEIKNAGDPISLAFKRMDSFMGQKLLLAFAHPSTKTRGAAKLYYTLSDQRRGFVKCPHCESEFWFQWSHVRACAAEGMNQEQADRDPSCYSYFCPDCACEISDAQRYTMIRKVEYKSTLKPEEAARRTWVGVHFSQLYMPNKTIRMLAEEWVECIDNESKKIVFYNKTLGEPYEPKVSKVSAEDWRECIVVPRSGSHEYRGRKFSSDPEAYRKGQVPPGVRFLTAGQDSRSTEFHYAVWGWGLCRTVEKYTVLRGWLIDWGTFTRPYSLSFAEAEFHAFDTLIYRRGYGTTYSDDIYEVKQCGHDTGWAPSQIPIHAYCRSWPHRAIPTKGAAETASSSCKAAPVKWGLGLKFKLDDIEVKDESSKPLLINTFSLKMDLYGWLKKTVKIESPQGPREVRLLTLPVEVDDRYLTESAAEKLITGKKGELVWDHEGPNHYADCNVGAYACALNLDPFQEGLAFEEAETLAEQERERNRLAKEKSRESTTSDTWIVTDRIQDRDDWISER